MMTENKLYEILLDQQRESELFETKSLVDRSDADLLCSSSTLAQVVIGVRRSGKSSLCHKYLKDISEPYAYVNFDDDRLSSLEVEDLNTVLSCIYMIHGEGVKYLFFDEIQNVEGWHLFVNRLLRSGFHVFVTGSNAKLLSSELATHLTGRYMQVSLYPFSFKEYCAYHNVDTKDRTTLGRALLKRAFMDYIEVGGLPELQGNPHKRIYINSLLETIVRKDIKIRFHIKTPDLLLKVANYIIDNTCKEINYTALVELFDIKSPITLKKYISYFEQAFLIHTVRRFSAKSAERIRGEKAYVIDPGFISNRPDALPSDNFGWRLENVVCIELLRRTQNDFLDLYYYKSRNGGREVDFVVSYRDIPRELIQVSYDIDSPKTFRRETSALIVASDELKCDNLTLVTFSESRVEVIGSKTINIVNAVEWLLTDKRYEV